MKPKFAILALALLLPAFPAAAQQAEKMTCEQAKAFFARNGYINKIVHGKPMPIRRGVPISQGIFCVGDSNRFTTSVTTTDKKRCNVAHYCN